MNIVICARADTILEHLSLIHYSDAANRERQLFAPDKVIRLSEDTYLEPDVVIYPRTSGLRGLTGANVLMVVEIADSSLRYDIGRKAGLYASFGVLELWVIDAV